MKRILFTLAFSIGIGITSFAQINIEKVIEKQSDKNLSLNTFNKYRFISIKDNLYKNSLHNTLSLTNFNRIITQPEELKPNPQIVYSNPYRMPCIKLKANDSMPILKPDSTVSYSLLIKKFE